MVDTTNKELIERLEQINKISDLGNVTAVIGPVTVNNNSVETKTILKMMSRMRDLEERIEALEKHIKIPWKKGG